MTQQKLAEPYCNFRYQEVIVRFSSHLYGGIFRTRNNFLNKNVCRANGILIRSNGILIRANEILIRTNDILIRANGI